MAIGASGRSIACRKDGYFTGTGAPYQGRMPERSDARGGHPQATTRTSTSRIG
jgi:hypothetical protein